MATKKMMAFEKSGKDKEPKGLKEGTKKAIAYDKEHKGMKEGSKAEMALDKKQASKFVPFKKGMK